MTDSREKGKRGEREVVALLKTYGFTARRGQQNRGGSDSPDVIHSMNNVHVEVKFRENFNLPAALKKAWEEGGKGVLPVVFHRKKRQPWMVTMDAHHFLTRVAKEIIDV